MTFEDYIYYIGLNPSQGDFLERLLEKEIERIELFEPLTEENRQRLKWLTAISEEIEKYSGELVVG